MDSTNSNHSQATISELEVLLVACDRILRKQIKEGKKGIVLAKGKDNEIKLSYKDLQKTIIKLRDYFGYKGAISIGICATCDSFSTKGHNNKCFGNCTCNSNKTVHEFDTCDKHSTNGGGYGKVLFK